VRPRDLPDTALASARAGSLDRGALERDLEQAGVEVTPALVGTLLDEAQEYAVRRALEDEQRTVVAGLGVPTYELELLPGGIDLGALYALAADLKEQHLA
jgi:hypothetical protein